MDLHGGLRHVKVGGAGEVGGGVGGVSSGLGGSVEEGFEAGGVLGELSMLGEVS